MRVMLFHQLFSTQDGATVTRSYTFARRLVARGHQVTVVCAQSALARSGLDGPFTRGRRQGTVDGIDIVELEGRYSNHQGVWARTREFVRYAWATIRIALTADYDLVFCKSAPLTAGLPGILAALLRRKPYVFEAGDLWPAVPRAMGLKNPILLGSMSALEWANYRTASLCIGVAPGIVAGFRARGVPETRTALVPNGCDLDLFVPMERSEHAGPMVAVYAGAHGRANGLETVVEAARVLDREGAGAVRIVLIGDGALKPALRRAAEGIACLTFEDAVPKTELARRVAAADCGITIFAPIPVLYDCTSPNKLYDYLAAGLPVVVAYPGWVADLVVRDGCGLATPAADPAALARALLELAADPARRQAMGRQARALAERELDREALADRAVDLLERLVPASPRPAVAPVEAAGR